jgi:hypothetical protein
MFNTIKTLIAAAALLVVTGATHADTFTYVCKDHGRSYPLKVDNKQNTLTWKGSVYKIKPQEGCAKYGWHAEKDGASFDFCTATKGYAGFENATPPIGTDIECNFRASNRH